jgi:hypothetical protein
MTSPKMPVAEAPSEEIIEITEDMILELAAPETRGKLLHFPPPLPRAQPLPAPRSRRRRGSFPVIRDPR